jgi:adenosine deaminase
MLTNSDNEDYTEIINMPKFEFHGHLNGILCEHTITNEFQTNERFISLTDSVKNDFTLSTFFKITSMISERIGDDREFVLTSLDSIVESYIKENCVYLEIRDTPKQPDYLGYLTDLLGRMNELQTKYYDKIILRFYLNLHRARSSTDVLDAFTRLPEHLKSYIIGIDIAGNTTKDYNYFLENKPIYQYFKELGYSLNFHIFEEPDEPYFNDIIGLGPNRLSQGIYLTDKDQLDLLIKNNIALEICPTFALRSTGKSCLSQFDNYSYLMEGDCRLLIGTDNKYILNTTLTNEYFTVYNDFFDRDVLKFKKFIKSSLDVLNTDLKNKIEEIFI